MRLEMENDKNDKYKDKDASEIDEKEEDEEDEEDQNVKDLKGFDHTNAPKPETFDCEYSTYHNWHDLFT